MGLDTFSLLLGSAIVQEIELEIPPGTQKGVCNTLEGVLRNAADSLSAEQDERKAQLPEIAAKVQEVIEKLRSYSSGEQVRPRSSDNTDHLHDTSGRTHVCFIQRYILSPLCYEGTEQSQDRRPCFFQLPFTFILDDPSGNSFIQFEGLTPSHDSSLKSTKYDRTKEQMHAMGYYEEFVHNRSETDAPANGSSPNMLPASVQPTSVSALQDRAKVQLDPCCLPNQLVINGWDFGKSIEENTAQLKTRQHPTKNEAQTRDDTLEAGDTVDSIVFHVDCSHCGQQGTNEMCEIDIPGFRRCIIMAFNCTNCGSRSNEVKPMGSYGDKARKWTLKVETPADLNRDVLKSDTASIIIPDLDFEMCMGTLGGLFTTVEGLILKV